VSKATPDSCLIRLKGDRPEVAASYAPAYERNIAETGPGQLVALRPVSDGHYEVIWRWHEAEVLDTDPLTLRDDFHGKTTGFELGDSCPEAPQVGQTVFFSSGMTESRRIDAMDSSSRPIDWTALSDYVGPQIAELYEHFEN
jgi:hypothetical protein